MFRHGARQNCGGDDRRVVVVGQGDIIAISALVIDLELVAIHHHDRLVCQARKSTGHRIASVVGNQNIIAFIHGHESRCQMQRQRGIRKIERSGFAHYRAAITIQYHAHSVAAVQC